jgi:general secretion pathway protein N
MRPRGALFLGAVAYGAFLVATAPAGLLEAQVTKDSRVPVSLANATGTVWNGRAHANIAMPGLSFAIDEIRWRFLPLRLIAGRAAFAIEARTAGLDARMEAARGLLEWSVRDLQASGDAAAFATFFPIALAWQPAGAIVVEAPRLAWDGRSATGEASVEWREATLSLSDARPLGSWRAQATAEGTSVKLSLATTRGPLRLSGTGTLAMSGRLAFSGEARAEPGSERDLDAVLALLGPRRADGAHAFELR